MKCVISAFTGTSTVVCQDAGPTVILLERDLVNACHKFPLCRSNVAIFHSRIYSSYVSGVHARCFRDRGSKRSSGVKSKSSTDPGDPIEKMFSSRDLCFLSPCLALLTDTMRFEISALFPNCVCFASPGEKSFVARIPESELQNSYGIDFMTWEYEIRNDPPDWLNLSF